MPRQLGLLRADCAEDGIRDDEVDVASAVMAYFGLGLKMPDQERAVIRCRGAGSGGAGVPGGGGVDDRSTAATTSLGIDSHGTKDVGNGAKFVGVEEGEAGGGTVAP